MQVKKNSQIPSCSRYSGYSSRQKSLYDIKKRLGIGTASSSRRPTIDTESLSKGSNYDAVNLSTRNATTKHRTRSTNVSVSEVSDISLLNATLKGETQGVRAVETVTAEFPVSVKTALKQYAHMLTTYEQAEILDYPEIFYLGSDRASKIGASATTGKDDNFGYDDERGDYRLVKGDHIQYRYEVLDVLGKGSFGQVVKVYDHKRKEHLALKLIRNQKRFHQQASVEIKILKALLQNEHPDRQYVIHIRQYFLFRKHACIVFELLSLNLYEFIRSAGFRGLSLPLTRRFAVQILHGMRLMAKLGIIHCDMKPENIMLRDSNRSAVKIIDMGSGCFDHQKVYTYIQSRFYRAPEIMLGIAYTPAIDMWSFGCILIELLTGYPIFPGESEQEQMALIMQYLGLPPADVLAQATRKKLFFEANNTPKLTPNSKGKVRVPGSRQLPRITDVQAMDLIKRCFDWNPETRITPDDALAHPWFSEDASKPPPAQPLKSTTRGLNLLQSKTKAETPKHTHARSKGSYGEIYVRQALHSAKNTRTRFVFN